MLIAIIIFSALISSAFFAGMEIAFITSNKLHIELESKQGSVPARIFSYFSKKPSRYLATMLLGNTIALVVFGIFMEQLLNPYIEPFIHNHIILLLVQSLISTMIILVTAEFLPKNLFRINPNRVLNIFAIPVMVVYALLSPMVYLIIALSNFILKYILRINLEEDKISFGRVDLDHYVREVTSFASPTHELEHEIQIFQNALDFRNIKVRDCMIPRTEIIAIDANTSVEELRKKFIQTRLSKILVYEGNIDNIIGYIHSYELFKRPETVKSILLPVSILPESMAASEVLAVFIQKRKSIAVVVDEFGGTSGILTIEDVMEEIFGEIEDEHDKEDLIEKKINENEYVFSGRLEIDYLNDKYKLNFPKSDEYKTLSGYIVHYHESIPQMNEKLFIQPYILKVVTVSETRVETVNVRIKE